MNEPNYLTDTTYAVHGLFSLVSFTGSTIRKSPTSSLVATVAFVAPNRAGFFPCATIHVL